jgi:hypothetical protein
MLKRKARLTANKVKVCKVCGHNYEAWSAARALNRFCGPVCAAKFGQAKRDEERAKARRLANRKAREALKTRGDWVREAQAAVNAYVRERDYGEPCRACGTTSENQSITGSSWDAAHYRSRGAAPHLRFHLLNIWKCCTRCNRELSGNVVELRKGMVARLGEDRVQAIEHDDTPRQYSIDDLKRIKRIFAKRAKQYRKRRGG